MKSEKHYDLVVVGAGVVGLATAYAARQRGLRVAVLERNAQCVGASVRNFGFVTVTGQRRGEHWRRAMRTRDIWQQVAPLTLLGLTVACCVLLALALLALLWAPRWLARSLRRSRARCPRSCATRCTWHSRRRGSDL